MQLRFGYSEGVPEGVETAWGARLIAPNDLLHDRQDLVAEDSESKRALVEWLNGGAIRKALDFLRGDVRYTVADGEKFVAYEDARGTIVANTKRSGGYVYVAGWLKPGAMKRYVIERGPITIERWHTRYGWSLAEAKKIGPGSSEVRITVIDGAERREIEPEHAGGFEMGYGGSGPHESARAIVNDLGVETSGAPADLQELVPEVFYDAHGKDQVTVFAADVSSRSLGALV